MIRRLLDLSIQHRWVVVLIFLALAVFGVWSLPKLPIDAVPDITNNQVQINTVAPALSPVEIEKQVTFPIETALAGIAGLEYTRSLSRNGFSQVTAVFSRASTDIYFARQQVNERLLEAAASLPPGVEPKMGPISTGLGEIYMWTVEYRARPCAAIDGQPGWQRDGSYLTPEGERLTNELERAAYLRTVQDWIIRPQIKGVPGVAGVDCDRRLRQAVPRAARPGEADRARAFVSATSQRAIEANNVSRGASYIERNGEGYRRARRRAVETLDEIGDVVVTTRGGVPVRVRDVAEVTIGGELAHRQRQRERPGGRRRHGADADRREQPHGGGRGRRQDCERSADRCRPASRSRPCSTAPSSSTPRSTRWRRTSPRARCWSSSCCSCCSAISAPR